MRVSLVRKGGEIGQHFGEYTKSYGFYRIGIASNEQKVWKGTLQTFAKTARQHLRHWWMFAIPGTLTYLTYDWGKKTHKQFLRDEAKNKRLTKEEEMKLKKPFWA